MAWYLWEVCLYFCWRVSREFQGCDGISKGLMMSYGIFILWGHLPTSTKRRHVRPGGSTSSLATLSFIRKASTLVATGPSWKMLNIDQHQEFIKVPLLNLQLSRTPPNPTGPRHCGIQRLQLIESLRCKSRTCLAANMVPRGFRPFPSFHAWKRENPFWKNQDKKLPVRCI